MMKKILFILLIVATIFSFVACGKNLSIDPASINFEYRDYAAGTKEGTVNLDMYIRIDKDFEGTDDDEYTIYYAIENDYQKYADYNLNTLKKGKHMYIECAIEKATASEYSVIVSKEDIANIKNIDQWSKSLAQQIVIPHCERPVALENKITSMVTDYEDLLRTYDLKWHEYPLTEKDHIDNLCYCLVTGNFEWTNARKGPLQLSPINVIKVETAGHLLNQPHTFCYSDGHYSIALENGAQSPLSPQDVSNQIVEAYNTAKNIHDELHSNGKITEAMTEKQIAEVYVKYLQAYGATTPWYFRDINFPENYDNPKVRIEYMEEDTAYGCLVEKSGCCGSRAAAYNLLMNMEGINTIGLHTQGHIVSYLLLDGEEYMCDWGSRIGLFTVEDVSTPKANFIKFEDDWLETVRDYYRNYCM